MRRLLAPAWAVFNFFVLTNSTGVAAGSGCAALAWDLSAARAQLTADTLPAVASGGPVSVGQAFRLEVQPFFAASSPVQPSRPPEEDAAVGWVHVAPPPAGRVQVVLNGEGWIDVAEGGAPLQAVAFTGAKDCAGVRKAVVFEVSGQPLTLQVVVPGSARDVRVALLHTP